MCSGKSTLGRAVALLTGMPFVDLDRAAERRARMSVPDIFAKQGEEAFRRLEHMILAEICASGVGAIVACGGGLPCQPGAMDEMLSAGLTVWLQPSPERLIDRLMAGRARRPLLAGIESRSQMLEYAKRMMADREPYYSRCAATFDSSLLETEDEIAATARQFADRFVTGA